jgi:cytochrome c oxidase subunit II
MSMNWSLVGRTLGAGALVAVLGVAGFAGSALAQQPYPWQMNLQEAHSPIMERIHSLHDALIWMCVLISLFVLGLLLWVMYRYNEKRNPVPTTTTHNTLIEVLWTVVPILILVGIAIISIPLLYATDDASDADITVKAIGRQWYWSFEYPDNGGFTYDSFMVAEGDLKPGQPRLLAADEDLVLPVGKKIRVLVTSSDVLHAFAVPSLGSKIDAVPGRINHTWFQINEPGMYYGQCSELCGTGHSFMPLSIRAVPEAEFNTWLAGARQRFAQADDEITVRPIQVVRNEADQPDAGAAPAAAQ